MAQGVDVINMSLGGPSSSAAEQAAVTAAWDAGIVVIASSGNTGTGTIQYPAGYDNVMGVAALTPANVKTSFSTTGAHVDIAAPGSSVLSTVPPGSCTLCDAAEYTYLNGTSMAAPHVAGVAALVIASDGTLTNTQVVAALEGSAIDLGVAGRDDLYGWGAVNACRALTACTYPVTGDYFEVQIDHTWVGDLVVRLESPVAAIGNVTLFARNSSGFGSSENDILVRYQLPAGTPAGVLGVMLVLGGTLTAQAGPSPAVAPSRIAVDEPLRQGDEIRLPDLRVSNGGDEPGQFRMDLSHFENQDELVPDASWLSLNPDEFRLEPGKRQSVSVRMIVPREAELGDYRVFLRAIASPEEAQGAVTVSGAVAVTLTFTVENRNFHFYDPVTDFFSERAPYSYIGLALLLAVLVAQLLRRRFRFRFSVGVDRRE